MSDDLQRHLDGDLPLDALGPDARREAEAWERLLCAFREEAPAASAPPWLETRVMAEIEGLPEPRLLTRVVRWLLSPRPVRVSPLTMGVAVAALAAILLVGRDGSTLVSPPSYSPGPAATPASVDPGGADPVVFVQFALDAPGASSVAVAGDFDGWAGTNALSDPDGDGVWTGRVPVRPGVHAYMFLVDGSDWITDPRADRYAEDGFGNRNAILAVAAPAV